MTVGVLGIAEVHGGSRSEHLAISALAVLWLSAVLYQRHRSGAVRSQAVVQRVCALSLWLRPEGVLEQRLSALLRNQTGTKIHPVLSTEDLLLL